VLASQGRLHDAAERYQHIIESAAARRAFVIEASIRQAHGEHKAAGALLRQAVSLAQQQRHPRFLAQAQAAQVRWWLAQGQVEVATRWREARVRADAATPRYEDEPEGYVRLFVDEGVPMLGLLRLVLSRWKGRGSASYVRQLLSILQAEHPQQAEQLPSLSVPLSPRERLILRGLSAGRSTTEMSAELVVSPNTIKAQVSSLYRKLNVHSREEAEAMRLHLL
jgi:ATP/maltotriose-dependent transcriptional regulator MalT